MNPAALSRSRMIDALRGVAVLLVLCRHHGATGVLHDMGWVGVDLFFVLSGYLVSGLLFDEYRKTRHINGWRFLARRGLKIYPLFYLFLLLSLLYGSFFGHLRPWRSYLKEVFFVQNYFGGVWNHTWSLAVEEHFYLLLTVVAVFLARGAVNVSFRSILWLCLLTMAACLVWRCYAVRTFPYDDRIHFFPTHARLDSLLCGVLLAAAHRWRTSWFQRTFTRYRWPLLVFAVVVFAGTAWFKVWSPWITTVGFTLLYLAGAAVLGVALMVPEASVRFLGRPLAALAWVGFSSYAIYLLHMLVLGVTQYFSGPMWLSHGFAEFVVYATGSVLCGVALTHLVERPVLMWRDRLFPK